MNMYRHFLGKGLNRSEKIQKWVVDLLLTTKIGNDKRESSVAWELKHSSGVIQLARLLAEKRGLDPEIAEIIAALHDIHVIMNGDYEGHARKGAEIARKKLKESGEFSEKEINVICNAIVNHSDKHICSKDQYSELAKDADTLDCFLYGETIYDYKPEEMRKEYFRRIIRIRRELGLPEKTYFRKELKRLEEKFRK